MPTDIKVPLVMYPAWPPLRCGRQGQAIVVNQALSINALRGRVCEVLETLSHRKVDICVFRRPYTVVATAAQSRARTPGTSSTGPETTKALLVLECLWPKSG